MTSLWSLPWCSTSQGPPSCLQVMVFMGGKLALPSRGGFSNPDRSAEDRPWRSCSAREVGGGLGPLHPGARPPGAGVHVLDPLEAGMVAERVAEAPKLGGAVVGLNLDVRELGRHDEGTEDRSGREVRHGE